MLRPLVLLAVVSTAISVSIPAKKGILTSTGPSDEPIASSPPNFPGGKIAVDAFPGPFFKDFQPPFPTDSWWSGLTVTNQNSVLAGPFPFQTASQNSGLNFGISDIRQFDGTSLKVPTQLDWSAAFVGLPNDINHRKALSWDTQTVCLQYYDDGQTTMDTCMVPGSPYMTFTYKNAAVLLTSLNRDITSFQWVNQGTKARVVTPGGTYLIYVVGGTIELTAGATTITSPPGFSGTLRFAKVKEPSQETVLDAHANTYATGLAMSYNVAGDVSTQTWTWSVVGNPSDLLILSWPHHRRILQTPNYADITYLTLKGYMKGVVGNQWVLCHDLPTISWFPANNPQTSCQRELNQTLEAEVKALTVMVPGDFYFWGGAFGRAAQLATIAEHIGRNDLIDQVVTILKASIAYWFDPTHVPAAAYETGWGGVINKQGWNNTWVDFGNAYYNDHHFHYGYFLHGAAVIAKYDPVWLSQHEDFITHFARDIGNPSPNDPYYTVTRHMDWFAGHSWASGIANGAGSRDQESTGEAINGYYGLLLWANVIQNQGLIDYSRMLLAINIRGAQEYWHLYPRDTNPDTPYPEQAFRDLTTVGNVMDWQTGAWLFWGNQKTEIAAIQILPVTPIGQYTYDNPWMQSVLPHCQSELVDPKIGDAFKSVIYAAYAKVNPQQAYNYSEKLYDWGSGNSATNQLYFVSTQSSSTDICSRGAQTPQGLYNIQDVGSGKFVTVSGNGQLAATTSVDVLATKFTLGFKPGGGTIQGSNGQYVTASPDGTQPLAAIRAVAQAWETFRWAEQGDGTYELTAMINSAQVRTAPASGQLFNNAGGSTGVAPSRYTLVPTKEKADPNIPTVAVLRNIQTNKWVVATAGDPTLRATANSTAQATRWSFEKVKESSANSGDYNIKSLKTDQYVTADPSGSQPLAALRAVAQGWESFQIVPYKNAYIILHVASGLAVAVQPDQTLIDNNKNIDQVALWAID